MASRGPRLALPLYVHPAIDPAPWRQVVHDRQHFSWVVVNLADGLGPFIDPVFAESVASLVRSGLCVLGYVDCRYGERAAEDVVAEALGWRDRYGVQGVFLDRVHSSRVGWAHRVGRQLRDQGFANVVGNPGVVPDPAIAHGFTGLVVFEGGHAEYEPDSLRAACTALAGSTDSLGHLVHGASPGAGLAQLVAAMERAGATDLWLTDLSGDNPYRGLPSYYRELVRLLSGPKLWAEANTP